MFSGERETYNCVGSTVEEIEKFIEHKMKEWGTGSRSVVWFQWNQYNFTEGHAIVVNLKDNGFVQYGDPQKNRISAVSYLNSAKLSSIIIMRIDNLNFTDVIKRCCMNRK